MSDRTPEQVADEWRMDVPMPYAGHSWNERRDSLLDALRAEHMLVEENNLAGWLEEWDGEPSFHPATCGGIHDMRDAVYYQPARVVRGETQEAE